MAITKTELKNQIKAAFDFDSDKDLEDVGTLDEARERIAQKIADAVEAYVVSRTVAVPGIQPGSGAATGTIQ
tara:strand:+ start:28434 stop:28649 length:216 start_codon:yes stop_codon:yes gene_type:complete